MSKPIRDVGHLTLEERAALEARLRKRREGNPRPPLISRHDGSDSLPLSFAQQRLWLLAQLEPESAAYNITTAIRLKGATDVAALEQSLNEVIRRHVVLRTNFATEDGQPKQIVSPFRSITLEQHDLSTLPQDEREKTVRRLAAESAGRPFTLDRGALLRASLLRLDAQEHVVLLTIHHIIFDAWSMGVLVNELSVLYGAFCAGASSPLAELPLQYADFALWQREWLQGEVLEKQLTYWKQQLRGAPAMLRLPQDRPRPAMQSDRGASHTMLLPKSLSEALHSLSREHDVTLFMTLLAAFDALLYRYTGEADVVVGTSVAGRNSAQVEPLIGFFVNTLVLRTDLSGDPSFGELLARVRKDALGAYAHQDLPFELLVSVLQPERSLSQTPFFQVMFTLQNAHRPALELKDVTLSPIAVERGTAKFDLELNMAERPEGIEASFEYNTDLFDAQTIERLARHFGVLLESVSADSSKPLSKLALMPEPELHQILRQWNETRVEVPLESCFHQLFEAQAARRPHATAVVCEQQQLTYAELNQLANRLARFLVEQGVGAETIVALLCERDINLLVAILAIFKAGGAYLPLDAHHPSRRLSQILRQSGSMLALTSGHMAPLMSEACASLETEKRPAVWRIEPLLQQERGAENLPARSTPEHLAYVIYTSGSSGLPKGAMVLHRGMLNHLHAKVLDLQLSEEDSIAQTASQCFDISVWQFLAPLLVGGRVEIISDNVAHDPPRLLQQIADRRISILEVVPSLLRAMLESIMPGRSSAPDLSALRWLILTGEALPPELCRQWLGVYTGLPLLNAYGPTECSDDVTHQTIFAPPPPEVLHMPIGRPIANTRLYILDRHLHPVPVGVAGELYVGGTGVGRGYLNDTERTAQSFIPDPFSAEPGLRLYATGDLSRFLADGRIEFLGRLDQQVKLRGFRIELGEIEAMLDQHPAVQESVVMAREETSAEKRLVAYVVRKPVPEATAVDATPQQLRAFLSEKLPEYMLPASFLFLEALPLTANGKVDRRLLPAPDAASLAHEASFVAPRDPTEERLALIWADVLGLERIGVHDNFFELGGHSLLATQVTSRVREAFNVELPLRRLFEAPTVAEIALLMSEGHESARRGEQPGELKRLVTEDEEAQLAQLELLSDDEVDSLLNRMLAEEEAQR